ncbi:MAG: sigma-70 family RNA polymerase sigma factor [Flammeovirgaceae bacterium]|nr:sigma-70 family RNA polymerase sigma factor [Flammeovirgaceae bacterium]
MVEKKLFSCNQPFQNNLRVTISNLALIEDSDLYKLLDSCKKGNRNSQDRLYQEYYGFSMGICLRYSRTREEAVEILNDGFIKIFKNLDKYSKGLSFKGWMRKVMINSAIDYFRRNEKHYHSLDISYGQYESNAENILDKLSAEEIISAIQQLPPSYRMVFNLYAVEGYKHEEIANQLNISVGTSKSNLSVARSKLQKILIAGQSEHITKEQNG